MIEIEISGTPQAQARARYVRRGKFVQVYDPQSSLKKDIVKNSINTDIIEKIDGAILAEITAYMPIPKSTPKKNIELLIGSPHTKKPDIDNIQKFYFDLLNGICYNDDSQIFKIIAEKKYDLIPRIAIKLTEKNE